MKKWKKVLIISSLCTLAGAFTVLAAPNYDNIAVSKVSGSVNIRTEANTTSAVTGKIQNDCAAEILETVDGEGGKWYKIRSGSVTGYIKAEYFVTGEAAAAGQRKWTYLWNYKRRCYRPSAGNTGFKWKDLNSSGRRRQMLCCGTGGKLCKGGSGYGSGRLCIQRVHRDRGGI